MTELRASENGDRSGNPTRGASLEDDRMLPLSQAAEYVGCHRQTLWKLAKSGVVRGYKIGVNGLGRIVFRKSDLDAFLERRKFSEVSLGKPNNSIDHQPSVASLPPSARSILDDIISLTRQLTK